MDLRTYRPLSKRLVRDALRASKNGLAPGQLADAKFENVVEVEGPRREDKGRSTMAPAVSALEVSRHPEGGTGNLVMFIPMVAASHAVAKRHPVASAAIIDLNIYRAGGRHAASLVSDMDRALRSPATM